MEHRERWKENIYRRKLGVVICSEIRKTCYIICRAQCKMRR